MADTKIDTNTNLFQKFLVPEESGRVRLCMRTAAEYAQSSNFFSRHVVSVACAVAAVVLSFFNTVGYFLQIPVKILLNVVWLNPIALFTDLYFDLTSSLRSLLFAAFGITYVVAGIFSPGNVFSYFAPEKITDVTEDLEKRIEKLEKQKAETETRLNLKSDEITALKAEQSSKIEDLQTEIDRLKRSKRSQDKRLTQTQEQFAQETNQLQDALKAAKTNHSKTEKKHKAEFRQQRDEHLKALEELQAQHTQMEQQLKSELKQQQEELRAAEKDSDKLQKGLADLQKKHETQVQSLNEKFGLERKKSESQFAEMEKSYKLRESELQKQFKTEIGQIQTNLKSLHEQHLAKVREEYLAQETQLKSDFEAKRKKAAEDLKVQTDRVTVLQQELEKQKTDLKTAMQKQEEQLKAEQTSLKQQLENVAILKQTEHAKEVSNLQQQLNDLQQEYQEASSKAKELHEKELKTKEQELIAAKLEQEKFQKSLTTEFDQQKADLKTAMQKQEEQLKTAMQNQEALKLQFEQQQRGLEYQLESKEQELKAAKLEQEKFQKSLTTELDKQSQEASARVNELQKLVDQQKADLKTAMQNQEALKLQFERQQRGLEYQLESKEQELKAAKLEQEKFQKSLSEATQQFQRDLNAQKTQFEQNIEIAKKEREQELKILFEDQKSQLEFQLKSLQETGQKKLEEQTALVEKLQTALQKGTEENKKQLELSLKDAKDKAEKLQREQAREIAELQSKLKDQREGFTQLSQEIDKLRQDRSRDKDAISQKEEQLILAQKNFEILNGQFKLQADEIKQLRELVETLKKTQAEQSKKDSANGNLPAGIQQLAHQSHNAVPQLSEIEFDQLPKERPDVLARRSPEPMDNFLEKMKQKGDFFLNFVEAQKEGLFCKENLDLKIGFNSEMKIWLSTTKDSSANMKLFLHHLKDMYGEHLIDRVNKAYQLDKNSLTVDAFRKALVGIYVRLNISDLEELFNQIKKKSDNMRIANWLTDVEKEKISKFDSFKKIPSDSEEMQCLVKVFRCVPIYGQDTVFKGSILNFFWNNEVGGQNKLTFDAFLHDFGLLQAQEAIEQRDENYLTAAISEMEAYASLAATETKAKKFSYAEPARGQILVDITPNKRTNYLACTQSHKNDGLICRFLSPVNTNISDRPSGHPIHITFRGTQLQPSRLHSGASFLRDLDWRGLGKGVFDANKDQLIEMLRRELAKCPTRNGSVALKVEGHSLGAVDTQRMIAALTEHFIHLDFEYLQGIEAFMHNAPGVEKSLNDEFAKQLEALYVKIKHVKGKLNPDSEQYKILDNFKIKLNYILFDTDPIHLFGDVYLGAGLSNHPLLDVKIYYMTAEQYKLIAAHGAKVFNLNENREKLKKQVIDKDTVDSVTNQKLLEPRLQGTWYYEPGKGYFDSLTKNILWYTPYLFKPAALAIHGTVYGLLNAGHKLGGLVLGRVDKEEQFT